MCDGRVPLLCRTFSLGSIDGQESQYSGASHVRESGDHGVACLLIDTPVHHHMPLHVLKGFGSITTTNPKFWTR